MLVALLGVLVPALMLGVRLCSGAVVPWAPRVGGPLALATTASTPPRTTSPCTAPAGTARGGLPPLPAASNLLPGGDAAPTAELMAWMTVVKLRSRCTQSGEAHRFGCRTHSGYTFHICVMLGRNAAVLDMTHVCRVPSHNAPETLAQRRAHGQPTPTYLLVLACLPTAMLARGLWNVHKLKLAQEVDGSRRLPRCMILELTGVMLIMVQCTSSEFEGAAARLGGEPRAVLAASTAAGALRGTTLRGAPPAVTTTSCARRSPLTPSGSAGGANGTVGTTWPPRQPLGWRLSAAASPCGATRPARRPFQSPALPAW